MCVIAVKRKNERLFTKEELENCFTRNSDGAGFMYVYKGQVVCDKGYMTFNDFYKKFKWLCKKNNDFKNKSLILHFRIGTAGKNDKSNTHPFVISDNLKDLHKTYIKSNLGVVHNGIIYDYNPPLNNIDNRTDTQNFIIKYLTPLYKNYKEFYKNDYILKGLEKITNSKLAFLDKNDNIYIVGNFQNNNGLLYSNDSYKKYNFSSNYDFKWWADYNSKYDYTSKNNIDNLSNYVKLDNDYLIGYPNGDFEEVGNNDYYFNISNDSLYIKNCVGKYLQVENDVIIYDKDFLEVFF